jgi:hypothetical protein
MKRRERAATNFGVRVKALSLMPGLDPGIHAVTARQFGGAIGMDCRVKPGNDEKEGALRVGGLSNPP